MSTTYDQDLIIIEISLIQSSDPQDKEAAYLLTPPAGEERILSLSVSQSRTAVTSSLVFATRSPATR